MARFNELLICVVVYIFLKGVKKMVTDFYYRGQENEEWIIMPTLARESENAHKLNVEQQQQFYQAIQQKEIFKEIQEQIALIGKMQHYGFSTHLIDITKEFEIALYFASQETNPNEFKDGEVIIFGTKDWNNRLKYNNLTLKIASEQSNNPQNKVSLLMTGKIIQENTHVWDKEIIMDYESLKILKADNLRIENQKGAFIIPTIENGEVKQVEKPVKIKITHKDKFAIMCELAKKGIHTCKIYPDKDEVLKNINKFYKLRVGKSSLIFSEITKRNRQREETLTEAYQQSQLAEEQKENLLLFGLQEQTRLEEAEKFEIYQRAFSKSVYNIESIKEDSIVKALEFFEVKI